MTVETNVTGPGSTSGFEVRFEGVDPENEGLRETLTSTGNGYFCSRGSSEWEDSDPPQHYPGTYAHGVFNRETTILGGRPVHNEDLVNLPNWLVLKLRIDDEDAVRLDDVEVLDYVHSYDIRTSTVARDMRIRDRAGRETRIQSRRFVSMANSHLGAIEWKVTAENWSGTLGIVTAIDGRVDNDMVARYRDLAGRHLDPVTAREFGDETIALKVRTRQSNIYIAQAARTKVFRERGRFWEEISPSRSVHQMNDYIQQTLKFDISGGETVRVEKIVSFYTSHDNAITETLEASGRHVRRYPEFESAHDEHRAAWDEVWDVCNIALPGLPRVEMLLRFHVGHIVQVCSRHTARHDAGVPARGLNGEAYRGHIFWDELFVNPFLTFRLPEITRGLLMYRYRRLAEARAAARAAGLTGAMFPWQSGSDGTEETQVVHLNPLSGQWDPDDSHRQRHVNAAIFYNIWQYYQATNDLEFVRDYGAELMLEIARFWAALSRRNPDTDRYEIHDVMGPDEFHERYPGSSVGGVKNNAYTNLMVAWIADTAPRVLKLLSKSRRDVLTSRLQISDDEIQKWSEMSRLMYVPFHETDDGELVISQFQGYDGLEELDWQSYRERYDDIQRMDRILKAEGLDPNRFKLSKQADTVMLFYLFSPRDLAGMLHRLGYDEESDPDLASRTVEYYDRRTSHGSTLSMVTHAAVLARIDSGQSWSRFLKAVESDFEDIQGGTTKEGIHMGVMAGTLDLVQRSYIGLNVRDGVLVIDPNVPDELRDLELSIVFQGSPIKFALRGRELTLEVQTEGFRRPVVVDTGSQVQELSAGARLIVQLDENGRRIAEGRPGPTNGPADARPEVGSDD